MGRASELKKALIVDDDDLVRPTVTAMLSALQFDVVETPNGKEALRLVAESDFDLVVTDLFMPGFDGYELMIEIRKMTSDIPIILMSGGGKFFPAGSEAFDDIISSAELLGASYVIAKPFRKADLARIVAQALPDGMPPASGLD